MSHALATMRVDETTKMKKVTDAQNPLIARREAKKKKAGKV